MNKLNSILKSDNLKLFYFHITLGPGADINTNSWILSSITIALFALLYPVWRRKIITRQWYKTLNLDKHLPIVENLYRNVNGFFLSREARNNRDAMEYTYGEIDFVSFIALLSLAKPDTQTIFYDLGSGTGKAVLACAMVFNVKKSAGIEIFPQLHTIATEQQQRLKAFPDYQTIASRICFINNDFLKTDIKDATLIFINATALFGESWLKLNEHLKQVKENTIIITSSKKLSPSDFVVTSETTVQMSWGIVQAFIHQRLNSAT